MMPNIKGTDSPIFCIYSTLGTTSCSICLDVVLRQSQH